MIPNEDEEVQEELGEDLSHDPDNLMACLAIQMTAVLDTLEHLQDGEALFHPKWTDISRQFDEMTRGLLGAGMQVDKENNPIYMDIQARLHTLFQE